MADVLRRAIDDLVADDEIKIAVNPETFGKLMTIEIDDLIQLGLNISDFVHQDKGSSLGEIALSIVEVTDQILDLTKSYMKGVDGGKIIINLMAGK